MECPPILLPAVGKLEVREEIEQEREAVEPEFSMASCALLPCAYPTGGEDLLDLNEIGIIDHRCATDATDDMCSVRSLIFQVRAVCVNCQTATPGTCFMVEELNRMCNTGDFYYFVTAGHLIYCSKCRVYRAIQISWDWEPQDPLPKVSFMPPKEFVMESSTRGWLAVPEGYKENCDQDKCDKDRYPFDYGVIAIRKDQLARELRSELDTLVADNGMFQAPCARDEFVPRAFLCGYPGEVNDRKVRGIMYWVPEWRSEKGEPCTSEDDRKSRRRKERNQACLYAMPQVHMSQSKTSDGEGSSDTNAPLAVKRLFRHYIDSSDGQSGSPVYTMSGEPGKVEYHAVGIHLGYWEIEGVGKSHSCNVALRMSEVVMEMKQWIKDNHDKKPVSDGKKSGAEHIDFEQIFPAAMILHD